MNGVGREFRGAVRDELRVELASEASSQKGHSQKAHMRLSDMIDAKSSLPDLADSMTAPPVGHEDLLLAQVTQAFSLSHVAALGALASAPIVAVALWNAVSHTRILVWLAGLLTLYAIRQVLAWAFHRAAPRGSEIEPWSRRYAVGAVAIGSWWGLTGILLFPPDSVLHQSLLAIFIAGTTCAAAVHHSSTTLYFPVILVMILPLAGRFLLHQGDGVHVTVGILILVYTTVLILMGKRMHATNTESLMLRFAHTDLVRSLQVEVSERRSAENALRLSEEKYRLLVENSSEAIFVIQDGKFGFVNTKGLHMSGYSEEEAGQLFFDELVFPADKPRVVDHYRRLMLGEAAAYALEFRWLDKALSVRWGWVNAVSIQWRGRPSVLCFLTDTTEWRRLEEKVSKTETLLRHVVENANDVIFLTNEKGVLTYANPCTNRVSGYSEEELIGKHYIELIVPEYRKEVERFYGLQFVKKIPNTYYEFPIRTKQGETLWLGQQVQLILDGDQVVGFQSICRDITARRNAEEALRENEEKFRQLADTIHDIIMLIAPGSPYRFIYVSPAYERVTGRKVDELYGDSTSWLTTVHENDRDQAAAFFDKFIQTGRDFSSEFRMIGPSGDVRWMWSTGFPIKDSDGNVQRLAVTARDVTQRKLDGEKLKHLVEEIKDFAYIVSHDFRAPLINIRGFAGELETALEAVKPAVVSGLSTLDEQQKSQVLAALDEDIPEALEFIRSSVSRMDNLINAILDLSRLERRELNFEPLNMNSLVEETLKTFSFQLNEANAHVSVGQLPDTVADRVAMEQILTNLLSNATKFRDPKRTQEIAINGYSFPDETVFVIRDRGRGVEKVYLSQIFQIFHRGSTRDIPGEGMGLAHVRALVRRHGGRIWCESEPGMSSTFTFTVSKHLLQRGRDEQSESRYYSAR